MSTGLAEESKQTKKLLKPAPLDVGVRRESPYFGNSCASRGMTASIFLDSRIRRLSRPTSPHLPTAEISTPYGRRIVND
jgi:hypothetical protein